eukprot:TRINITY_DN11774_c0_g1_i2.p1 TRINITY_DN11774_c0_g1~~TRINITY_DN11774_c0_g1_i2.p1  ORF type:complete len:441 (+),score=82.59 TRINITY_DN11774_c0_g1_i2:75-1325(+)
MSRRVARSLTVEADGVNVFGEVAADTADGEDLEDLEALTAGALDEIRQLKNPAIPIRRTLEVVHILLNARRYQYGVPKRGIPWERVLRTLASEDLAGKMQAFNVESLRQLPRLVKSLQEVYFTPPPAEEDGRLFSKSSSQPLSRDRVRRASLSTVTIFGWAVRAVAQALPEPEPLDAEVIDKTNLDFISVTLEEPPSYCAPQEALPPFKLSLGVWATCPGGHGMDTVPSGKVPACNLCGVVFSGKGSFVFGCRDCAFAVCECCRDPARNWLQLRVPVLPGTTKKAPVFDIVGAALDALPQPLALEVVHFRWLRTGEMAPAPLDVNVTAPGSFSACWGQGGPAVYGEVPLVAFKGTASDSPSPAAAARAIVRKAAAAGQSGPPGQPPGATSSLFNLIDARGASAAIRVLLRGCPGED